MLPLSVIKYITLYGIVISPIAQPPMHSSSIKRSQVKCLRRLETNLTLTLIIEQFKFTQKIL